MIGRAHMLGAAAVALLGSASALAVDASCVGVQVEAAQATFDALSEPEKALYQPVMAEIEAIGDQVAASLAEPERQMQQLVASMQARMPGATEQQVSDAIFHELTRSIEADNIYALQLRANGVVHTKEGNVVAHASRLADRGFEDRANEVLVRTIQRHNVRGLAEVIEASPDLRYLYAMEGHLQALKGRGFSEPGAQRLAGDAARLSRAHGAGFDRDGLPTVNFHFVPAAGPVTAAIQALGVEGELKGAGLVTLLPAAGLRREIMRKSATTTGTQASRYQAESNIKLMRAREALRRAAEGIADEQAEADRRQRSPGAAKPARRPPKIERITILLDPCHIKAVGLKGQCNP